VLRSLVSIVVQSSAKITLRKMINKNCDACSKRWRSKKQDARQMGRELMEKKILKRVIGGM
jgi:hypothetical protein